MSTASTNQLQERLDQVQRRIDEALHRALRNRRNLTLVAVTKRQPLRSVLDAYALGLRDFGESQVQEGLPKIKSSPKDITWHFIGHLQKNKVRPCVKHFQVIHSIESESLLRRVDRIATEERYKPTVFLQVNLALDPDKHGLHPDAVEGVLEQALACDGVECVGLMAIPPVQCDSQQQRDYFNGIAELRNRLVEHFPEWPGRLSLGMSNDFEEAIESGAHLVRIGTALFGERNA